MFIITEIITEFNLLHEEWIAVLTNDGQWTQVSLIDAFKRAPELKSLAGELPGQDMALLRFLLAVLHSTFRDFGNEDDALDFWEDTWRAGTFPHGVIERYLDVCEDRFWLFHPEQPFFQIPGLDKRKDVFGPFSVPKLNGELSESDNKLRHFRQRSGVGKNSLSFAEATRWLLYFNGFAETFGKLEARKKENKTDISLGVGWLGKLGLIAAAGENLFQTLMLNFVLLNNNGRLWEAGAPIWEKPVCTKERNIIPLPRSQCELLTLQSRRVLLEREEGRVTFFRFVSGDVFEKENAYTEQMTPWRTAKQPGGGTDSKFPKPFQPAVQLWRDFSTLIEQDDKNEKRRPGIVNWLDYLIEKKVLPPGTRFTFTTTGIEYGTMQAVINDVFSDSLSFNAGLLSALHKGWVTRIIAGLALTESLVKEAGILAQRLVKASGADDGATARDRAKTQAYYRLDEPFRRWLESIDPDSDDMNIKLDEWWTTSQKEIRTLGRELVDECPPQALTGRGGISAPNEYYWFMYYTKNSETLKKRGEKKSGKSKESS